MNLDEEINYIISGLILMCLAAMGVDRSWGMSLSCLFFAYFKIFIEMNLNVLKEISGFEEHHSVVHAYQFTIPMYIYICFLVSLLVSKWPNL